VVHDAHLFFLQIHASSFAAGWQGEVAPLLLVQHSVGGLGYGSRMLQNLILIDALSSACWEKKRKKKDKKERNDWGTIFPGPDMPCWLHCAGFLWLLGVIKG
jgi:hypothetical protein